MNHGFVVVAVIVVGACLCGCGSSSSSARIYHDSPYLLDGCLRGQKDAISCADNYETICTKECQTTVNDLVENTIDCCKYAGDIQACENKMRTNMQRAQPEIDKLKGRCVKKDSEATMSELPNIQRLVFAEDVLGIAAGRTSAPVAVVAVGVATAGISGALVAAAFASWTGKQSIALSD
eukprot:TRINITY_DN3467_c0_g1_i2.p1 TRINITY_DN3467_c0_g1~~TRINITY_DN3467_c0_g1_i2.p1  ORF type:complete len:179 (-),score=15.25 TRINITY_DN3467_c0_g1_i2:63-599(-)